MGQTLKGAIMAEVINSVWYEARMIAGSGRLADTWESLSEAKKGIDRANLRAEKNGYQPSSYLITKTTSESEWTDKGKFKRRTVTEVAVQTYPKEK